jgi:DNA-directed RNA polymerase subunit RPC12/RpoP
MANSCVRVACPKCGGKRWDIKRGKWLGIFSKWYALCLSCGHRIWLDEVKK